MCIIDNKINVPDFQSNKTAAQRVEANVCSENDSLKYIIIYLHV